MLGDDTVKRNTCLRCPATGCVLDASDIPIGRINRSKLAKALGHDRHYITRILEGKVSPSMDVAYGIARYLGVSLDALYRATKQVRSNKRRYRTLYYVHGDSNVPYPTIRKALQAAGAERIPKYTSTLKGLRPELQSKIFSVKMTEWDGGTISTYNPL